MSRNLERKNAWARANYRADREKFLARSAAYRKANPGKIAAYKVNWQKDNRDRVNAASKRYRLDNPDRRKEIVARWNNANRQKKRAYSQMRLADPAVRARAREVAKRQRDQLMPCYVQKILKSKNPDLVTLKALQIRIKRLLHEKR